MSDREEGGGNTGFRFSPRPNRAGEIQWRAWGDEAFAEARRESKLVLLSISAVWCHWCHVMDETTYSDQGIIDKVNRDYIPVRVDSDRRPEINRRYNQGGWPTTAFLIPSGRAVAGLTYAPPEQLQTLLDRLAALYRHRRDEIESEAAAAGAGEREAMSSAAGGDRTDPKTAADVEAAIMEAWDKGCGGLGDAPKFPSPGPLEFALARYLENGGEALKSFVVSTLDGMSLGEMYDRVEGGFFRYATARDWNAPHYEKMLGDNASLIYVYLAASAALGRPDYAEIARGALDYTVRTLLDDEQRGFYGSQDADESYYHRDAGGRAGMEAPFVDRTIYTDTTSLMISALTLASAVLEDPGLLGIAQRSADFIWRQGLRHGVGLCHYFELPEGSPSIWGQPADQVNYLRALLDLYQATTEPRFLERAVELGGLLLERYVKHPGWLGEAPEGAPRGEGEAVLDDVPSDVPEVVVNGVGARALLLLEALAPGHGFGQAAKGILESLASRYSAYTYFAAEYALAVELLEKGLVEVRVAPDGNAGLKKEITAAAAAAFNPRKLVRPETVEDFLETGEGEAPPAVVCSPGRCTPVHSAAELNDALASLSGGRGE